MCSGKGDFQSAFSQQLFIAIHQIFIILRDVVLTKTNTVSFISLTWLSHVGCRFCPFNLFYFRFLAETTSKLLILWEELQPCRQLKQTTMTRWGSETWQFTFCVAVFINLLCCAFSSEWNSPETCVQVFEALVHVRRLGGEPGNIPGNHGYNVLRSPCKILKIMLQKKLKYKKHTRTSTVRIIGV